MAEGGSAHALLFPFPIQGHVPPMLKLAELLSHAGLHITVVLTGGVRERLSNNSTALARLSHIPYLRFRTVPDGATREDPEPWVQVLELLDSTSAASREPYREILAPQNGRDPDGWPPVTCVVADGILPLALEVAEEQGIPVMLLRTSSACSVWAYYSIPELIKRGELPFAEGADMDEPVRGVAGMESFLRRRDLPGLLRHAKSPTDRLLGFLTTINSGLTRAEALILNTFDLLEATVLSSIRSVCPVTYTIGPLHLLARNTAGFPSFWQQDRSCIEWLDRQPAGSVVYVSFGSITVMSGDKLLEFWHGLVSSGQRFLWVARPDLVRGLPAGETPAEVEEGTRERGCLVPWAPQEEVLAHPAVGCFLTHSGWNSTMESIAAGVPMVCWFMRGLVYPHPRRWKQCMLALMNLFKGSCSGSTLCTISVIEAIISCDTVDVDNLKNEVLHVINSLSFEVSITAEGKGTKPPSSVSESSFGKKSSNLDTAFLFGKDVCVDGSGPMQRPSDQEVIVLSDDETVIDAFPQLVSSSRTQTNQPILDDILPSNVGKGVSPDGPTESINSNVSKDILEPFPSRIFTNVSKDILDPFPSIIFTDESPLSSQEQITDVLDSKRVSSEIKVSVGNKTSSLIHTKGTETDRKMHSLNNASDVVRSLKDANSNCKGSSAQLVKHHLSNQTVSSSTLKNDPKVQKDDAGVTELVCDSLNDPLEHALDNFKRPQFYLTKPTINVPKRKIVRLQMPSNEKSGFLNRMGTGVRRLKPPRLDDWYRPILELDYFSVVGLSTNKDEKHTPSANLKEVPLCFKSVDHYVEIFRPLVLEEFKAQLHNSYIETSPDAIFCGKLCILSVERIDDFHLVRGRPDDCESAASKGWLENDLVLLTRQPLQNSVQDVHILGKVERREKSNKSQSMILVIRFYLLNGSPRLNKAKMLLVERSKWYLSRIMSITPQIREFQALSSLNDIPMLPVILNPVERSLRRNEYGKVELSKLAKPLQNILKASFNGSQLEAISIAIGAQTSRSNFELCLIQGPPGTGKTRTIVATVSALLSLHSVCDDCSTEKLNSSSRTISASCTNPRTQISQSAAIARAWQDAALAKQMIKETEKKSSGQTERSARGRVLICAQSNAAVDELVSRISEGLYGNDGKLYMPYLVRVGNAKTVHPNSQPFFIDRLVEQRLADDMTNQVDAKTDTNAMSPSSLRARLEKLVDSIRYYESRRAKLDSMEDGNTDNSSDVGTCNGDDVLEISDAALGAKLNILYGQKRALCAEIAAAQSREKKASEESWLLKNKIRKSILMEAEIVVTTLSGSGGDLYGVCSETASSGKFGRFSEQCLFDVVVIDEAAQALEPATLIPLQLLKSNGTKCIMVGDPKQLPATVLSNVASKFLYECSMFERLQRAGHPVVMLTEQYRMHPEISRFPSLHFYENKLLNGVQMASKSAPFHEHACLGPYMFYDIIDGREHHGKSSASLSLYNESEVEAAIRVLKSVKSRYPLEFASGRIGIITPYRSQLSLLRSRFSNAFGPNIASEMEFNTVDGFQGREVDILVLSTVRASESTNSSSIGFVADVRRMNVALTRAKFSLWIVGNARTLQRNPHWDALIENAKQRNLFISISRPYATIFGHALPSSTENPCSKPKSHSGRHPKFAEKVRYAKEVPAGKPELMGVKSRKQHRGSQNSSNDDIPSSEGALRRSKDRESTERRCPLQNFEGDSNKFRRNINHLTGADNSLRTNIKCSRVGDKIVQNVRLETDSSSKELINKVKEAQRYSKHDLSSQLCQQSSSMTSSAEESPRLHNKATIKKTNEQRKSLEHAASSKSRQQSSTLASAAEEGHRVGDQALTKKSKERRRSLEHDTSSKLGHHNSSNVASSVEGSHSSSDTVSMKQVKEGHKSSEHVKSSKFSQPYFSAVSASAEGSHRTSDANDSQPSNPENPIGILKVKAKGSRRFSEHGTSSRSSQSPSALSFTAENKMLTDKNDGKPSVGDAPKNLMATRKRQREDIDALLSSALIPSKKSENSSRPGSVKRI